MADVFYKPFSERVVDTQYKDGLRTILENGYVHRSKMDSDKQSYHGITFHFDLSNGFPVITERDVVNGKNSILSQSIGELCAFLNGKHTQEDLSQFGCFWWSEWVSEKKCAKRGLPTGDLGPGSYGPAWTQFPTADGGSFNQIEHIIKQIQELPELSTHQVTPYIPQYIGRGSHIQQKVVVVPCHGSFNVTIDIYTNELRLIHVQRSADYLVGLAANLIMYGALTLMLGQVTGYTPKELVYMIQDAHLYTPGQDDDVRALLNTADSRLPTVTINDPSIKNIFDFRKEHFSITDYYPQSKRRKIWTPV